MTPAEASTDRRTLLAQIARPQPWDLAVVGGGATGLGVALLAARRGLRVVLVEADDFASGTSSRSTKLVHGGVRYLAQGRVALVRQALHERKRLMQAAPHLVQPLPFVVPAHRAWDNGLHRLGLGVYDWLAGADSLGRTEWLSNQALHQAVPGFSDDLHNGGIRYWDAQFDDARFALALARSAVAHGAVLLNHCPAVRLLRDAGRVRGLVCRDAELGVTHTLRARCVVNATGVWSDAVRGDGDGRGAATVLLSRGAHLVVPQAGLLNDHAVLLPQTADGRVLFAVPWLGHVLLGTTDTPHPAPARDPLPSAAEVAFILTEINRYTRRPLQPTDVRSLWAGLRPLALAAGAPHGASPTLSREHRVHVAADGLISVVGGKWTTFRVMAVDALAGVALQLGCPPWVGQDAELPRLAGAPEVGDALPAPLHRPPDGLGLGRDAAAVQQLPGADRVLGLGLSEARVRFAVRHEFARTVADVLARRARVLMLDAACAERLVPRVAAILREEGVPDPQPAHALLLSRQQLALTRASQSVLT
ncbi:hypothetical protein CCO03_18505 [Comamonas serinivorans]|uniref:FAD-dependent oxidoreductase n=1 Tax=Comamonas serinivorans TaxID=1082851 RepID=A0A1Y0ETP3_9BURK|nr:glycerol-3-phosphate dehydrogenase/oxidase [Comamonas serinivorans]ARU06973.1 hypothetical protein CCO03_18505 [Comamonas serinivorans]